MGNNCASFYEILSNISSQWLFKRSFDNFDDPSASSWGWLVIEPILKCFDNFTLFSKFVSSKPSRVLLSTPCRSPISYHLKETEDRNSSRTCFCAWFQNCDKVQSILYHVFDIYFFLSFFRLILLSLVIRY